MKKLTVISLSLILAGILLLMFACAEREENSDDSSLGQTNNSDHSDHQSWTGTKQLGTSSDDQANGVATDSLGNVYVAGYTNGGLDGNSNAGDADLFVVKYNSSGTKQWTKQMGTSSHDEAHGVATDSSGNVYVAGQTLDGLDGNSSAGSYDLFVVKYNSSGTKQWTQQLGSSSFDEARGVATDSSGNVYVAGSALYKFDSSGNQLCSQNPGAFSRSVATDSSGNIYVTGATGGGLDGNSNAGAYDLFVVKYDSDGNKQ